MKKTNLKLECTWNIVNCDTKLIGEQTFAWWLNTEKKPTKDGFAWFCRSPNHPPSRKKQAFLDMIPWMESQIHRVSFFASDLLIPKFLVEWPVKKRCDRREGRGILERFERIQCLTCTVCPKSLLKSCWPLAFILDSSGMTPTQR